MGASHWGVWSGLLLSLSVFAGNGPKVFSVMTYNVQNLFDNVHDEGKNDWEFLPLEWKKNSQEAQEYCQGVKNPYYKISCMAKDWNRQILRKKIENLSRVITSYDRGRSADIVVLQEVENINVLKLLRIRDFPIRDWKLWYCLKAPTRGELTWPLWADSPYWERPPCMRQSYTR